MSSGFRDMTLTNMGKRSFFAPTRHIKTIITLVLLGAESWLIALFKALMQLGGFLFDIIGLTEVFKIPDSMSFNITGYHCLQFQTRSDTDDGRGGVGLFINSNFRYVKRDDL